jgi:hypothetical protein
MTCVCELAAATQYETSVTSPPPDDTPRVPTSHFSG